MATAFLILNDITALMTTALGGNTFVSTATSLISLASNIGALCQNIQINWGEHFQRAGRSLDRIELYTAASETWSIVAIEHKNILDDATKTLHERSGLAVKTAKDVSNTLGYLRQRFVR